MKLYCPPNVDVEIKKFRMIAVTNLHPCDLIIEILENHKVALKNLQFVNCSNFVDSRHVR